MILVSCFRPIMIHVTQRMRPSRSFIVASLRRLSVSSKSAGMTMSFDQYDVARRAQATAALTTVRLSEGQYRGEEVDFYEHNFCYLVPLSDMTDDCLSSPCKLRPVWRPRCNWLPSSNDDPDNQHRMPLQRQHYFLGYSVSAATTGSNLINVIRVLLKLRCSMPLLFHTRAHSGCR